MEGVQRSEVALGDLMRHAADAHGTHSVRYHALAGMEEALEKLGVGIAVVALLDHVRRHVAPLAVVVKR